MNGLNEYFEFQHHLVKLGYSDQISEAWECLYHIRTKDLHPAEVGYSLDIIQIASEWHNNFEPDYSYLNQFL